MKGHSTGSSWAVYSYSVIISCFSGIRRSITVFTKVRHSTLFWVRKIHSPYLHDIPLTRLILIISSHILIHLETNIFLRVFQSECCFNFSLSPCLLQVGYRSYPTVVILSEKHKVWLPLYVVFYVPWFISTAYVYVFSSASSSWASYWGIFH
jgi:hypothetical protein